MDATMMTDGSCLLHGGGRALMPGETGPDVRDLQASLAALGWSIDITGSYDDETVEVVKAFQDAAGMDVDGIARPDVRERIATYVDCNTAGH